MSYNKNQLIKFISNPILYKNTKTYLSEVVKQNQNIYKIIDEALCQILLKRTHPPSVKLQALQFFKQLFQLGQFNFIESLDQKIQDQILDVARYKKQLIIQRRGQNYFIQVEKKQNNDNNKQLGINYILFSLEIFKNFADWYPIDFDNQKSRYVEYYTDLVKQGVTFPKKNVFFKQTDKQKFQKNYKKWLEKDTQVIVQENNINNNEKLLIEIKNLQNRIKILQVQLTKSKQQKNREVKILLEEKKKMNEQYNELKQKFINIENNRIKQGNSIQLKSEYEEKTKKLHKEIENYKAYIQQLKQLHQNQKVQKQEKYQSYQTIIKNLKNQIAQNIIKKQKQISSQKQSEQIVNIQLQKLRAQITILINQDKKKQQIIKKLKNQLKQAKIFQTASKQLAKQKNKLIQNVQVLQKKLKQNPHKSSPLNAQQYPQNIIQRQKRVYSISRTQKKIIDKKYRQDSFHMENQNNNITLLQGDKLKHHKHKGNYFNPFFRTKAKMPLQSPKTLFHPTKYCLSLYQGDIYQYNQQIMKPLNLSMVSYRNACLGVNRPFFHNNQIECKIVRIDKKSEYEIQIKNLTNKQMLIEHRIVPNESFSTSDINFKEKYRLISGKTFSNKISIFLKDCNFKYLASVLKIDFYEINLYFPITLLDFCKFSRLNSSKQKHFNRIKTIKSIQFRTDSNIYDIKQYFHEYCIQQIKHKFTGQVLIRARFNQDNEVILQIIQYKGKCILQISYEQDQPQNRQFSYHLMNLLLFCFKSIKND